MQIDGLALQVRKQTSIDVQFVRSACVALTIRMRRMESPGAAAPVMGAVHAPTQFWSVITHTTQKKAHLFGSTLYPDQE